MEPHAEELSRRISEIDLSALANKDTLPEYLGPRYTKNELLKLRPETQDGCADIPDHHLEGVKTPATPPAPPPPTPASKLNGEEHSLSPDDNDEGGLVPANGEPKKKKKRKKSSGFNKKSAATGFEEFYADPPLTPDEHEEESDLYSSERPFHVRIQTCIQRYRARRKLDEARSYIITKYLQLGGVEAATNKTFTGGLDQETLENSTAEEIAAIRATDFVRAGEPNARYFDPSKPDGWTVDFEGVAKGFLSYTAPRHIGDNEDQVRQYCGVVKNFLNYVLSHAVCPEYTNDILAARTICDLAEKETFTINVLQRLLPGDFSVAASTLYGSRYQALQSTNQGWGGATLIESGLSTSEAQRIFKTAIALAGTDEMFKKVSGEDVEIIKTEQRYLQVVSIEMPSPKSIAEFATVANSCGEPGYIKALGVLNCKAWEGPGLDDEDMTDDEDRDAGVVDAPIEQFWLEHEILQRIFVGLKMEVMVTTLNIGIKFFDELPSLYCSFHTYLPNEKTAGWKEPKLNPRPAPTEDDPDAEENAMCSQMERDFEEDEKMGKRFAVEEKAGLEPIPEVNEVLKEA